jgi:hypothetical protein
MFKTMKTKIVDTFSDAEINSEEIKKGEEIVRLLQLKLVRDENNKRFNPERYNTTHGTKTALGLYRTLESMINS